MASKNMIRILATQHYTQAEEKKLQARFLEMGAKSVSIAAWKDKEKRVPFSEKMAEIEAKMTKLEDLFMNYFDNDPQTKTLRRTLAQKLNAEIIQEGDELLKCEEELV